MLTISGISSTFSLFVNAVKVMFDVFSKGAKFLIFNSSKEVLQSLIGLLSFKCDEGFLFSVDISSGVEKFDPGVFEAFKLLFDGVT